jgi:hypothetical protein
MGSRGATWSCEPQAWQAFREQLRAQLEKGRGKIIQALFDQDRFLQTFEDSEWAAIVRSLMVRAMELYQHHGAVQLSVPELYPGKPLLVGDGAPRPTEVLGQSPYWLIPFIPLPGTYSGAPLRQCVGKALGVDPRGAASYINVRLLGPPPAEDSEVRAIVKALIKAANPSAIVALGNDAAQQLERVIPANSFGRAPHPRWALVFNRLGQKAYGELLLRELSASRLH